MFQNLKSLHGLKIRARDGEIGEVQDFYFSDDPWVVRYIVVETRGWLPGRLILLPPQAFQLPEFGERALGTEALQLNLSQQKIEKAPSIAHHQPISRRFEVEYHRFNDWRGYWETEAKQPDRSSHSAHVGPRWPGENQLRRTSVVAGYHLQASDGQIGTVTDFMIHRRTWEVRELVIETGHWYSGKKVLLLPESIDRISDEEAAIYVNLKRDDIHLTVRNGVAQVGAGSL